MHKALTIAAITITLSGCATPPPWLAHYFDSQDPCQSRGEAHYKYPNFCGAGGKSMARTIYDSQGRVIGSVR